MLRVKNYERECHIGDTQRLMENYSLIGGYCLAIISGMEVWTDSYVDELKVYGW